jgi:hypothetical protein
VPSSLPRLHRRCPRSSASARQKAAARVNVFHQRRSMLLQPRLHQLKSVTEHSPCRGRPSAQAVKYCGLLPVTPEAAGSSPVDPAIHAPREWLARQSQALRLGRQPRRDCTSPVDPAIHTPREGLARQSQAIRLGRQPKRDCTSPVDPASHAPREGLARQSQAIRLGRQRRRDSTSPVDPAKSLAPARSLAGTSTGNPP